jgi:AsmA family protein
VLVLDAPLKAPFPLEVNAAIGRTTLRATGTVASLSGLDGADLAFDLRGANLGDLYSVVGVVFPATPRYAVSGRAGKSGPRWTFTKLRGTLGRSDIAGELAYDKSRAVPLLTGALQSRALDFNDLAPLIGLPEQPRSAAAPATVSNAPDAPPPTRQVAGAPAGRVLPTATLDLERLKAMDADVRYSAAAITHVKALPLDRAELRVRLSNGVLDLDPMKLGVAGGSLAGSLRISAEANPAPVRANFNVEGLQLNRLFPTIESTRSSFGKLSGKIDLRGRGNSVAQMLGRSSGNVALLMGQGQISNLLLETMGLDGGEIIKFLVRGDQNVQLRCAAAAFDVTNGVMESRAIVLDTSDTVITGGGRVSLLDETIDITLRPRPKDGSILSLRSPLKISGTFNTPRAGPDKAALAGRAGLAIGLALVNPLLGLAATVETGPGKDADCQQVLKVAATPQPVASRAK